ncbi:P-loop containing nucleoside triphosphate hydrolase protein [Mytilinidion resinicola]|uniref:P-loop containing nucleoside triphosphate hydrolase protein n=1 Tax=Mytilinidion resinicola TaxID=574789 RepID=A0A6A6XZ46_9PEZI|nr:P-loop containing nucleoside triphosphate hydrolase protein [Mytilinidion resinicola]KAF2801782.1 P-loop containing nucleoside triphosphate hydrolase protein [Mytilinidion resinicola]
MERESSTEEGENDLEYIKGEVEFRNISFSYPGSSSQVIHNMNITIEGGSKVAFVGPSGVGKSTAFKLLMGMLEPTEGTILIDGQDIKTLKTDSLHEVIGMMPQNSYLFNTTVMENITFARQNATYEECYDACCRAGIEKTIKGRAGQYGATTGENGANFSGGERQRLVLARIFIQKPKIVLIDEGTSALDAETEALIKHSIDQEFAGRTVIIVAHRLSSIRRVDKIFVLGTCGKIVEEGNHDELVAKGCEYAKYWKMHLGEELPVDEPSVGEPLIDVSS